MIPFEESEVGPYFMACMILMAVVWIFAFGEPNSWEISASIASVAIMIFGIIHLKKQNGGSFGNRFVCKYFCLGWVVTVRMLLLTIPTGVVVFALASIIGGDPATDPAGVLFTIGFEILFYWWLGSLIAQSNQPISEQSVAPNA